MPPLTGLPTRQRTLRRLPPPATPPSPTTTTSSHSRSESQSSDPSLPRTTSNDLPKSSSIAQSSNIKLFLGNIKALGLDDKSDYPGVDEGVFGSGAGGQKKRVQVVEWALFHLFRLWDLEETRQKLAPLYPPPDQVTSIKLRTTLFQLLDALKKNGILSREIILRKSMLDDCKGDRLEEVLSVFSGIVLKKMTTTQLKGRHPAIVEALAFENRGWSGERKEMGVLMIAYRAHLSKILREREVAKGMYNDLSKLLDAKENEIVKRQEALKDFDVSSISKKDMEQVFNVVRTNWAGSDAWLETLLHGPDTQKKDSLLATPFGTVWRNLHNGRISTDNDKKDGLLEQLNSRIQAQQGRLTKLQDFRDRLFGTDFTPSPRKRATTMKRDAPVLLDLEFTDHLDLSVPENGDRKSPASNQDDVEEETVVVRLDSYDTFLSRFATDFAAAGRSGNHEVPKTTWRSHKTPRKSLRPAVVSPEAREALEQNSITWNTPSPPSHRSPRDRAGSVRERADSVRSQGSSIKDQEGSVLERAGSVRERAGSIRERPEVHRERSDSIREQVETVRERAGSIRQEWTPRQDTHTRNEILQRQASPEKTSPKVSSLHAVPTVEAPAVYIEGEPTAESPWERAVERPIRLRRGDESPGRRAGKRGYSPRSPMRLSDMEGIRRVSLSAQNDNVDAEGDFLSKPRRPAGSMVMDPFVRRVQAQGVPKSPLGSPGVGGSEFVNPLRSPAVGVDEKTERILQEVDITSPSPIKRTKKGRELTLAERTRYSMMGSLDSEDSDPNGVAATPSKTTSSTLQVPMSPTRDQISSDLVSRTRLSMAGFEAAQKKAQEDRRRSIMLQRSVSNKERKKWEGVKGEEGNTASDYEERIQRLMEEGRDGDFEEVFRSRPKVANSPLPWEGRKE